MPAPVDIAWSMAFCASATAARSVSAWPESQAPFTVKYHRHRLWPSPCTTLNWKPRCSILLAHHKRYRADPKLQNLPHRPIDRAAPTITHGKYEVPEAILGGSRHGSDKNTSAQSSERSKLVRAVANRGAIGRSKSAAPVTMMTWGPFPAIGRRRR
jgi:hypothetical protein